MATEDRWKTVTAIVGLITGLVGLASAVVVYQQKAAEVRLRDEAAKEAERQRAQAALERRRADELQATLDAQTGTIHRFIEYYAEHLRGIRDAQSRLAELQGNVEAASKLPAAEEDLLTRVRAFVSFVEDWKVVQDQLAKLLNGDVARLSLAAAQRDLAGVSGSSRILELNTPAKLALLEEQLKRLTRPPP